MWDKSHTLQLFVTQWQHQVVQVGTKSTTVTTLAPTVDNHGMIWFFAMDFCFDFLAFTVVGMSISFVWNWLWFFKLFVVGISKIACDFWSYLLWECRSKNLWCFWGDWSLKLLVIRLFFRLKSEIACDLLWECRSHRCLFFGSDWLALFLLLCLSLSMPLFVDASLCRSDCLALFVL